MSGLFLVVLAIPLESGAGFWIRAGLLFRGLSHWWIGRGQWRGLGEGQKGGEPLAESRGMRWISVSSIVSSIKENARAHESRRLIHSLLWKGAGLFWKLSFLEETRRNGKGVECVPLYLADPSADSTKAE